MTRFWRLFGGLHAPWPGDSGRASKSIPKNGVKMLQRTYEESVAHFVRHEVAPALGVPLVLLGNRFGDNATLQIINNNYGGQEGGPRPREDRSLAKAWLAFFGGLPADVREEHRIACDANGGTFYFYAAATGLWMRRDKVVASERLVTDMETLGGGSFWTEVLTSEERRYGTLRGQTTLLTCLIDSWWLLGARRAG